MPARQSKVELYAAIRRDSRAGMSGRELQGKYNVSYRTVRAALTSVWPTERKKYPPRASKLDEFKPIIDEWLSADLDAPRKQRHTVRRVFARLIDEHHMVDVSYETVREYVAKRGPEIRAAAGRGPVEVFIAQTHRPGEEAEVDFGELMVELRGEQVKMFLFAFRLSFSGKSIHRISTSGGQEAFLEGHVHAFRALGGVPFGKVRYDNLNAAVARVIGFSRLRVETDRWTAFRSHYTDFEAFYCQPGLQGAHEKGGVEGQIGWFRRNHLVPVPCVNSVEELNAMIDEWDAADDARGSVRGPGRSASISRRRNRCSSRCRTRRSRPGCGSPREWTGIRWSRCAPTGTASRSGCPAERQSIDNRRAQIIETGTQSYRLARTAQMAGHTARPKDPAPQPTPEPQS